MLTSSPRLLYEKLAVEHADGLFQVLGNRETYEHIEGGPPKSVAELGARFSRMVAGPPPARSDERWIDFAVKNRADGALIGLLESAVIEHRAEVAYLFGPPFWGQGFATEAMSELQRHLRESENVVEFWATTTPQNQRSIRFLERLGYKQIHDKWPRLSSYDPGDLVFALR